jgi:hypothetical protein
MRLWPTLFVTLLLAPAAASAQTYVGNTVSTYAATGEGVVPEEPDNVVVASVPVPLKYRSKKHFLLVTSSVQELCLDATLRSFLTINGVAVTLTAGPTECNDADWAFRTRQWSFPPAALGGEEFPPGALVELYLSRPGDSPAAYGPRTLRVEIMD